MISIKINKIKARVIRKAIFTKKTNIKFTKVINNSTSSFIGNAKKAYGPIKVTKVRTEKFMDVLRILGDTTWRISWPSSV